MYKMFGNGKGTIYKNGDDCKGDGLWTCFAAHISVKDQE